MKSTLIRDPVTQRMGGGQRTVKSGVGYTKEQSRGVEEPLKQIYRENKGKIMLKEYNKITTTIEHLTLLRNQADKE